MVDPRILLLLVFIAIGCGKAVEFDKSDEATELKMLNEGLAKLESLTNVYPLLVERKRSATPPPQFTQNDNEIDLSDLGLVLRRVNLVLPIDRMSSIFFSETEITNQMYATFLDETGQYRDDTDVEKAAGGEFFTTASPIIQVKDTSSLWRNGKFPENRDNHPVSCVTIAEATAFCKWLGERYLLKGVVRLPTEEEWLSAAYGTDRHYPWGDEKKDWTSDSTVPVKSRPELKTSVGLFGMWGNVSELVLSDSNGYGGQINDKFSPFITTWMGPSYQDEKISGQFAQPRQSYWGYTHSLKSRSDECGFRIVFVPTR